MITITLHANPGVDPDRALRRLLRYAGRYLGLRCTAIRCDALVLKPALQDDVANVATHARKSGNDA